MSDTFIDMQIRSKQCMQLTMNYMLPIYIHSFTHTAITHWQYFTDERFIERRQQGAFVISVTARARLAVGVQRLPYYRLYFIGRFISCCCCYCCGGQQVNLHKRLLHHTHLAVSFLIFHSTIHSIFYARPAGTQRCKHIQYKAIVNDSSL